MPLVGVIEAGTVPRVLRSVAFAKGSVLILFQRDRETGHILYEKGELITARLNELRGQEAVDALKQWSSGHYSLLKRQAKETETRGHVLLSSLDIATRRKLERALRRDGYTCSIAGYPEHARQVIAYIQPDIVLMPCPKDGIGMACAELSEELRQEMKLPPAILVVEKSEEACTEPDCVRCPSDPAAVVEALEGAWVDTRYGIRQQAPEETAKIFRPTTVALESTDDKQGEDGEEKLAAVPALHLALVLTTLVLGSALIWGWWWLNTR
jgi:hypothetical protein